MGLLKRMRDITLANLHERLDRMEDPVRYIDQCLAQLQKEIAKTQEIVRQSWQHALRLKREVEEAEKLAEKRQRQAEIALGAGEEDIARLALEEKLDAEHTVEKYRQLYEQNQMALLELEDQLKQLKEEYAELYEKRRYYAMRMETIKIRQHMNERWRFREERILERLEDRIAELELEAQSLQEIRRGLPSCRPGSFRSSDPLLESELEKLKKKLERERGIE